MLISDLLDETAGVGKIVKGVNTTADVKPGEIKRQAAKFRMQTDDNGVPPVAHTDGKLGEARSQEIVHTNPSVATLKALARNNPYGSARFIIYNDGTVVAGDSKNFTHQSMAPAIGAWNIRGYIQHLDNDDYAYRSMEVNSHLSKDHPIFRAWEKQGIENGNNEQIAEKWSRKYKRSIDCSHPRGFSQKAHCAGRKKRQRGGHTRSRSISEARMHLLIGEMLVGMVRSGMTDVQALEAINERLDENLRKWFQQKWVRFGPDGKIRGACARGSNSEGKPKCLPQSKAHALGKKGRASAARRKRRKDPNPERRGPAKNVATKESMLCPHCGGEIVDESQLYEKKDACYYKVKRRYKVWPSAYASGALVQCRKKGAKNWGKAKTTESTETGISTLMHSLDDKSSELSAMSALQRYDKIDSIMKKIALQNGITPKELHDAWMKKYHEWPDTWVQHDIAENFADGKGPGRPGDSARHGIPHNATISQLKKHAKRPGRAGQLARWQLNMRRGKSKK